MSTNKKGVGQQSSGLTKISNSDLEKKIQMMRQQIRMYHGDDAGTDLSPKSPSEAPTGKYDYIEEDVDEVYVQGQSCYDGEENNSRRMSYD